MSKETTLSFRGIAMITMIITAVMAVTLQSPVNVCRPLKDSSEIVSLGYDSQCRCNDTSETYGDVEHVTTVFYRAIECHIPASLDAVVFMACMHQQENITILPSLSVYYSIDEDVEWKVDPFTLFQIDDSVILTRRSSMAKPLSLNVKIIDNLSRIGSTDPYFSNLKYTVYEKPFKPLYQERIILDHGIREEKVAKSHLPVRMKRETSAVTSSGYLVVANRLYLHQISLDGNRTNVVVGGLSYAIAVDYHFRNNSLYWIDSGKQAIMKSTLDGLKRSMVLDHGLNEPESLSIDWINNKLYWTDVRERRIGVLDLSNNRNYKHNLLSTVDNLSPRGIAVDPTTRTLYWTEWSTRPANARVNKASMDGSGKVTIHQTNMQQPYGITIDVDNQVIYWADLELQQVEMSNVDGSNRRVVVSSGVERPYSLSLHGDTLYISDWNRRILSTNKTGGQAVYIVNDTFCTYLSTFGVQVIAEENQLQVTNPCATNNGGCSHLCLLSSTTAGGYSCDCPEAMSLGVDGLTCSQVVENMTTVTFAKKGSCEVAGFTDCCTTSMCWGSPANCFCDSDCYLFGDCCSDIENTCSPQSEGGSAFLLLSNALYIHRISTDGIRNKTVHASARNIIAIDYNFRTNEMYWSTTNGNGLWRSELDGSGAIAILTDNVQTVDDIAVDWISSKVYWTNSGPSNGIRILDLLLGHTASIINTGQSDRPRAIVVDPVNRWMYWTTSTKIEKASMDGQNRTVLHSTGLQQPYGLSLDYEQSVLYWIDAGLNRIEVSGVNGSNRRVVVSGGIYSPFGLSVFRGTLYYTDEGIFSISTSGGTISTVYDSICADTLGIEVVSVERQPSGTNPCQLSNGGCSHLCLLSSVQDAGYSCFCPEGFNLGPDAHTCSSNSTSPVAVMPVLEHGTCVAAGYISGCCTSGACRGSPPTCSCDSTCVVFQDCCVDVPPSCQPSIDVLEFFNVTTNLTVVVGKTSQIVSQLHCSVRASRVTNFEWTFSSSMTSHLSSSVQPTNEVINNEVGTFDARHSVVSTDYSSVLTIDNVEFSDAGNYTCIASIGERISPIRATAIHSVEVFPSLLGIVGNTQYTEGQTVHLRCQLKVFPPPTTIVWIVRDSLQSRVLQSTPRVSISSIQNFIENEEPYSKSELYISRVTAADSGVYVCGIESNVNNITMVHMIVHNVTVNPIDECEQSPPVCLNGGACIDYDVGYQCLCANNFTGRNCSQRIDATIPVSVPVFIASPNGSLVPNLGDPVNLTCLAEGHPPPSYQWFKDGVHINGETRSYLYISDAVPSSRGNYSCTASNSERVIMSDSVQLTIQGVSQYLVVLGCQTCNASEEVSAAAISYLLQNDNHQNNIYSVEEKTQTNSSYIHLLVTVLKTQSISHREIRDELITALGSIGPVTSLTRYDGCELNDHGELNIGDTVTVQCPCQEYLNNVSLGLRRCGGSFTNGAQLEDTDYSQCVTDTDNLTRSLCLAVMGIQNGAFLEQSLVVANIMNNADILMRSSIDITLLSVLAEILTESATLNLMVRENYLKIVDYYQRVVPYTYSPTASQAVSEASSRVLHSIERFAAEVAINSSEEKFIFQSFGIAIVNVVVEEFHGHRFSVVRSVTEGLSNTSYYHDIIVTYERGMTIANGTEVAMNNSAANLYISYDSVKECAGPTFATPLRLVYFAFFTNSLFNVLSQDDIRIVPLIIAARLNCSDNKIRTPITVTINNSLFDEKDTEQANCASWLKGPWSTSDCNVEDTTGEGIRCECYQFSHFGVVFEETQTNSSGSSRIAVHGYTYFALSICFIFLMLAIIPYTVSRSIWTSTHGITTFNEAVVIALIYVCFLTGAHVQSIYRFCSVVSFFLQLFILVQPCLMLSTYIILYISLRGFPTKSVKKQLLFGMFNVLSAWILPFVYVSTTTGVWHKYYLTDQSYYCGVTDKPLWFGLALPLGFIFVLHLILISLCFLKLVNCSAVEKYKYEGCCNHKRFGTFTILVLMSVTFFICWTFGLLSINQKLRKHSKSLQVIFATFTIFQGILVFAYSISSNNDAKKFWIRILSTFRCTCIKTANDEFPTPTTVTNASVSSVTSLSVTSMQSRNVTGVGADGREESKSSALSVGSKKSRSDKRKNFIPTDTNQAYQTVMLYNKKRHKYTITTNEAYATVNSFAQLSTDL